MVELSLVHRFRLCLNKGEDTGNISNNTRCESSVEKSGRNHVHT